jgi:hypothetical protein
LFIKKKCQQLFTHQHGVTSITLESSVQRFNTLFEKVHINKIIIIIIIIINLTQTNKGNGSDNIVSIKKLQTQSFHGKFIDIKRNNLRLTAPIHILEIETMYKTVITSLVLHLYKILSLIWSVNTIRSGIGLKFDTHIWFLPCV